jgi:hypothetical protein
VGITTEIMGGNYSVYLPSGNRDITRTLPLFLICS